MPKALVCLTLLEAVQSARLKETFQGELFADEAVVADSELETSANATSWEYWMNCDPGTDPQCGCPEKSACPSDHWFCRKNGGCYPGYPSTGQEREKECGTPFCPPHVAGRHRMGGEDVIVVDPTSREDTGSRAWRPPSGSAAFLPIDTAAPPAHIFEPRGDHYMPPRRISAEGKHQSNKFWTNWISGKPNDGQKPIFTMPYALRWSEEDDGWKCHYYSDGQDDAWCKRNPKEGNFEMRFFGQSGVCGHCHCCRRVVEIKAELEISHGEPKINYASGEREGRIAWYMTRFSPSFSIGVKEQTNPQHYDVTEEGLLGIHAKIRSMDKRKSVTFPVYRGMAYVSGQFNGMTPRISSPQGWVKSMTKVSSGIFEFKNNEGDPEKLWGCHYYKDGENDGWCKTNPMTARKEIKFFGANGPCGACHCCERPIQKPENLNKDYGQVYRVYVLDNSGKFMSGVEFTNSSDGFVMNKPLHGWVRMAHVVNDRDATILDKHAGAVLDKMELFAHSSGGKFGYTFETAGNKGAPLHWAWIHQKMLMKGGKSYSDNEITHILAPTKGNMVPMVGNRWDLEIDLREASKLELMPPRPRGGKLDAIKAELNKDLDKAATCHDIFDVHPHGWATRECEWPRVWLFAAGFYNNGKGLQRLGTTCLMAQQIYGSGDARVQKCAGLLKTAYECHYNEGKKCGGVPRANYDQKWGGIASKQGFNTKMCGLADFGNACYNDHHYHYGYFIHSGAILMHLKPEMKADRDFIAYVNSMVRDIANPSRIDTYFPQFRAFDWYDLHSWSHGVTPSSDGKDEESTSEDMNAYFGIQMWAKLNHADNLKHTADMMLALLAHSASNLFLISDNNQVHPKDYIKNRVTGIFFESKVHYGTFFGASSVFIHGIQMIPLTPALKLARSKDFCKQEYRDIVSKIPLPMGGSHADWGSLLITGNVAFVDPEKAWGMLMGQHAYDKGLSKAWAMYWVAHLADERR
jgi:endoglucanase Acf2